MDTHNMQEIVLDWQYEQDSWEWLRSLIVVSTRSVQINSNNRKIFKKAAGQVNYGSVLFYTVFYMY